MAVMPAVPTARARARAELVEVIKRTASAHLADSGAAALSLRAVSRELGMASSAVYRYFPSRDALLTALIVDAYDAVGDTVERADAKAVRAGADPGERWLGLCRALRRWAVRHPHEYALVYGSPVPGYSAPQDTVVPAARLTQAVAAVIEDGVKSGLLGPPRAAMAGDSLLDPAVWSFVARDENSVVADAVERTLVLTGTLVGTLSYLQFGHLRGTVIDEARWFDRAMAVAAEGIGLPVGNERP